MFLPTYTYYNKENENLKKQEDEHWKIVKGTKIYILSEKKEYVSTTWPR